MSMSTSVSTRIPFIKMHGVGNDFVVIDDLAARIPGTALPITPEFARHACDRRFGIGADQLLWLRRPLNSGAHARMEILNADGSVAEMCGNGIRAVALYLDRKFSAGQPSGSAPSDPRSAEVRIETLAGLKSVWVDGELATVDMGSPILGGGFPGIGEGLLIRGRELRFFEINVGNPHAVIFVDDVQAFPVADLGPQVEVNPRFPNRTNVEFVQVLEHQLRPKGSVIQVRVWERGAGITLACGTGACAAAVTALASGRVGPGPVEVRLPGGNLKIQWAGTGQPVTMTGPAVEVFRGEIPWGQ
ncbi:MAG: diaminopimelate epimerase [Oligoflexia bacterium]|nr:diaminopimelate epimerase [Oligoflexia bacterium]